MEVYGAEHEHSAVCNNGHYHSAEECSAHSHIEDCMDGQNQAYNVTVYSGQVYVRPGDTAEIRYNHTINNIYWTGYFFDLPSRWSGFLENGKMDIEFIMNGVKQTVTRYDWGGGRFDYRVYTLCGDMIVRFTNKTAYNLGIFSVYEDEETGETYVDNFRLRYTPCNYGCGRPNGGATCGKPTAANVCDKVVTAIVPKR